jgi:lipopolysaccharide transport system ATP-binding protein
MKPAIQFENISKVYRIGARPSGDYATLRETLMTMAKAPWERLKEMLRSEPTGKEESPQLHWALRDVGFEVQAGEVIGIVGRNGAGKSTLLKILSQITEPTDGRILFRGRVGSLLEVGTGFHHELTGRENIYLNGAILGMTRREIKRKFDDIVEFSEIGEFLDTPVKYYSSGMYVRLAFAVASHLEPEILVVDEVLAVGDAGFQKKCLGKMGEVSKSGRTVLFVSHSMAAIQNLCERVAVLERGRLVFLGDCATGIEQYMNSCGAAGGSEVDLTDHPNRRPGSRPIYHKIRMLNAAGNPTAQVACGEPATFELEVDSKGGMGQLHFGVIVEDSFGSRLFTVATLFSDSQLGPVRERKKVLCHVPAMPLAPGRYALSLVAGPLGQFQTDAIDQAAWFDVVDADFYGNGRLPNPNWGRFLQRSQWEDK